MGCLLKFVVEMPAAARSRKPAMKSILVILPLGLPLTSNVFAVDKLLQSSDITYIGSFRVPHENYGPSSFEYGGGQATYHPAHNSLFLSGSINSFDVAEINIPTPRTGSLAGMNTATVLQNFSDPTEGRSGNVMAGGACCVANGVKMGGLLVYNNKLIGTSFSYYDPEPYLCRPFSFRLRIELGRERFLRDVRAERPPSDERGDPWREFRVGLDGRNPPAYQSALGATHIRGTGH